MNVTGTYYNTLDLGGFSDFPDPNRNFRETADADLDGI